MNGSSRFGVGMPPSDLYGVAQKDRKHALVKDEKTGAFVVRDRKSGRIVKAWGDGTTTKESR